MLERFGPLSGSPIGSVGPVMNETLADYGFRPDIVPSHPKMAVLVRDAQNLLHGRDIAQR